MQMYAACRTVDEETLFVLEKERDALVGFLTKEERTPWSASKANSESRLATVEHNIESVKGRMKNATKGSVLHVRNCPPPRIRKKDSEQFMVPLAPDAPAIQETTEPRSEKPPLLMVAKASEQDRLPHAVKLYSFEKIPQAELSHAQIVQAAEMAVMARSRGGRVPVFALPTPLA